MLFNSYIFILIFLPIVLIGFFLISKIHKRLAIVWLLIFSLIFYSWWSISFTGVLLISAFSNYILGYLISNTKKTTRKLIFYFSIIFNLSYLGYFKYINFLLSTFSLAFDQKIIELDIILPLGISFFTFTQLAFLCDVYSNKTKEHQLDKYLLFVTYFPHLIAGPIIHHLKVVPQFFLKSFYTFNIENFKKGLAFFIIGLSKKIIIADNLAIYSDSVFDAASIGIQPDFIESWVGVMAFTFQLYFDFSGYCDMAIGLSLMLNVKLPINFNSPYKSVDIINFWRKWHITLSTFLKNYLYIPLGGNKFGLFNRYKNLLITMLLGGLWHGANLTFIIWGGLHGFFLIINHLWKYLTDTKLSKLKINKFYKSFMILFTFFCVSFSWIFFRSENLESSMLIVKGCLGYAGVSLPSRLEFLKIILDFNFVNFYGVFINIPGLASAGGIIPFIYKILFCFLIVWFIPNTQQLFKYKENFLEKDEKLFLNSNFQNIVFGILLGILFCISFGNIEKISPFLYYQF